MTSAVNRADSAGRWTVHHTSFVNTMPSDGSFCLSHSSPQLHRLIMEEDEKETIHNERPTMNGGVSAVTVRETTTEGIVRQRAKFMLSQASRKEEGFRTETMSDIGHRKLNRPTSVDFDTHSRLSTITTTAVLETPPHSREGTLERGRTFRSSIKTSDVMCSTTDLNVPRISITPADEKPCEKIIVSLQQAQPATEPLIQDQDYRPDIPDGGRDPDRAPDMFRTGVDEVPTSDSKKIDEKEDSSCLVDCLYFTMQCCECNII